MNTPNCSYVHANNCILLLLDTNYYLAESRNYVFINFKI